MTIKHKIFTFFTSIQIVSFFFSIECMNNNHESCMTSPFSDLIQNEDTIKLETIFPDDTDYIKEQINNLIAFSFFMKKAQNNSQKNQVIFNIKLLESTAKKRYKQKIKQKEKKNFLWGFGLGSGIGIGIGVLLTYFSPLTTQIAREDKR